MASSGGGFVIDDFSSLLPDLPDVDNAPDDATVAIGTTEAPAAAYVPQPLTPKQEARLRSYLDDALLVISRGYRKRFDPASPLPSLIPFWQQWSALLGVLARVPPYGGGSTNLLVSYLLRCTSDICDGFAGYSLAMEIERVRKESRQKRRQVLGGEADSREQDGSKEEEQEEDEEELRRQAYALKRRQLNIVLEAVGLLDRMWAAILQGHMINFLAAQKRAREALPDPPEAKDRATLEPADKRPADSLLNSAIFPHGAGRHTSSLVPSPAVDGRFQSASQHPSNAFDSERESLPVQGGKGIRTVGQTDRVRLRNIAVLAREKLFAWMREELDAPLPPTMEEEEEDDGIATAGDIMPSVAAEEMKEEEDKEVGREIEAEEALEGEMEDVPIDSTTQADAPQVGVDESTYNPDEDTAEHRHFQQLFDRKIDPDADDSDEEREAAATATASREAASPEPSDAAVSRPLKRRHSTTPPATTAEQPDRKTARPARAQTHHHTARSEAASADADLYSDSVARWDLAFTRIFGKTLRIISNIAETSASTSLRNGAPASGGIGTSGEAVAEYEG